MLPRWKWLLAGWAEMVRHCFFFFFFLTKSQSCNFTNKDSGARCWGDSLLAQRQRKHPADFPKPLFLHISNNKPQTEWMSHLLPKHLSIPPPDSLYGFFLSTGCLLGLLTHGWLNLILFTVFKQKVLELKVCEGWATPQLEKGFPVNNAILGFTCPATRQTQNGVTIFISKAF